MKKSGGFPPEGMQECLKKIFGNCSKVYSCDTLQADDYKKYHITMFDEAKKRQHHKEQFGIDLQRAFDLGAKLVRDCSH
jgi:hypothetical protein